MKTKFQKICAWCKKDLGVTYLDKPICVDKNKVDMTISYGICIACKEKVLQELHKNRGK